MWKVETLSINDIIGSYTYPRMEEIRFDLKRKGGKRRRWKPNLSDWWFDEVSSELQRVKVMFLKNCKHFHHFYNWETLTHLKVFQDNSVTDKDNLLQIVKAITGNRLEPFTPFVDLRCYQKHHQFYIILLTGN